MLEGVETRGSRMGVVVGVRVVMGSEFGDVGGG